MILLVSIYILLRVAVSWRSRDTSIYCVILLSVSDTAVRWCCALVLEDCSQLFIFSQYCLLAHSALVDHSRRLFTAIWYLWFVIFITKKGFAFDIITRLFAA